ncbi:hypothetical protein ACFC63_08080 [Streptomyces albidoflavus]
MSTWIDSGGLASVPIAHLLIGHHPPRRGCDTVDTIEAGLLGMADAMHLRPAAERVPHIGDRLVARGRFVVLDYGHPEYSLRLPSPNRLWRSHLDSRGPVCLTIGLDPMPPGMGEDAIRDYLIRTSTAGRAYMGATSLRTR